MSINASYLVSLTPRTIRGGSADLETNGCVLTTSPLIPGDKPALVVTTAKEAAAIFGAASAEARFAQQYFSGLNNSQKAPSALVIAADLRTARAAFLRSASHDKLAELKAVTAGTLTITVNGTEVAATGIDLSACTSLSAVATAVAAEFTGVTGAYNSDLDAFIFTTEATGAEASLTFATGTLAEPMGLTEAQGAVLAAGVDAKDAAGTMDAICAVTQNFVCFTTIAEITDADEAAAFAAWADLYDEFYYINWQDDPRLASQLTIENAPIWPVVQTYNTIAAIYALDYLTAAAALSYSAGIAWNLPQGFKVLFGKGAAGIPATVTDEAVAAAMDAHKINYVGQFATRNASFVFFNRGALGGEMYGFIDVLLGNIWLRSCIQRAVMDLFAAVNRIPYTEKGYSLISAAISGVIDAGKTNGTIDAGMSLSQAQRAQIAQEVGRDISDELFSKGWFLYIADPAANVRAQRGTPVATLLYCYAGSVQRLEMPVTAIL